MAEDWEQIRREHAALVWGVAWRILASREDALDCSQDVFLEAFQRGDRRPVENWPAFLRWLTTRRAIDMLRRRRRQPVTSEPAVLDCVGADGGGNGGDADLIPLVRSTLADLPASQAAAFWMACVEGLSYAAIAAEMQVTVNAVGVLVHRARLRLREALKEYDQGRLRR